MQSSIYNKDDLVPSPQAAASYFKLLNKTEQDMKNHTLQAHHQMREPVYKSQRTLHFSWWDYCKGSISLLVVMILAKGASWLFKYLIPKIFGTKDLAVASKLKENNASSTEQATIPATAIPQQQPLDATINGEFAEIKRQLSDVQAQLERNARQADSISNTSSNNNSQQMLNDIKLELAQLKGMLTGLSLSQSRTTTIAYAEPPARRKKTASPSTPIQQQSNFVVEEPEQEMDSDDDAQFTKPAKASAIPQAIPSDQNTTTVAQNDMLQTLMSSVTITPLPAVGESRFKAPEIAAATTTTQTTSDTDKVSPTSDLGTNLQNMYSNYTKPLIQELPVVEPVQDTIVPSTPPFVPNAMLSATVNMDDLFSTFVNNAKQDDGIATTPKATTTLTALEKQELHNTIDLADDKMKKSNFFKYSKQLVTGDATAPAKQDHTPAIVQATVAAPQTTDAQHAIVNVADTKPLVEAAIIPSNSDIFDAFDKYDFANDEKFSRFAAAVQSKIQTPSAETELKTKAKYYTAKVVPAFNIEHYINARNITFPAATSNNEQPETQVNTTIPTSTDTNTTPLPNPTTTTPSEPNSTTTDALEATTPSKDMSNETQTPTPGSKKRLKPWERKKQ